MENGSNNNKRRKEMTEVAEMAGNGSRWQPTKEQIEILESVYSAGVKTPSAEQIQQITARLSVYGTIEGKNVFYWFQNTKARRRQKLKQDRLALLTRFYPPPPPPPPQAYYPPIIPNVAEAGFYYYHCDQGFMMEAPLMEKRRWIPCEPRNSKRNQEYCSKTTLELFPLRPGGDSSGSNGSNSSDQTNDEDSACKDGERFIDFLSGNCSSATETNE